MILPLPRTGPSRTLQIAVDDEDQIVETLATGKRDRAKRLRLVAFAIAQERPHTLLRSIFETAVLQILVEASLIDRHDRAQAHRHRRVFPEAWHQPWVRVA